MAISQRVKNAMEKLGMKKGVNLKTVVKKNEKALAKQNNNVKNHNKKVYQNMLKAAAEEKKAVNKANSNAYNQQKKNLYSVVNTVRKYEKLQNAKNKNSKNRGQPTKGDTKVRRMALNYNKKVTK